MSSIDIYVQGYLDYLKEVRKLKKDSVKDVACSIKKLRFFVSLKGLDECFWNLDLEEFSLFFKWVLEEGLSKTSAQKFVTHLRGFLNYSWRVGKVNRNALDGYSIRGAYTKVPPKAITEENVKQLIKSLPQTTQIQRQKRLIVLTLYGLGLRTGELCRLNIQHIDLDKRMAYIFQSKNDVNRYIPIPEGLYLELAIHIKGQRKKTGPLFLTHHKKRRPDVSYIGAIMKESSIIAGLDHVKPKYLRHSFATHMINRGVPIEVLASLMGHKSPKETGVYLHSFEDGRKKSIDDLEKLLTKED